VLGVVALDRWRVSVLRRTASADGIGGVPAPVRRPAASPSPSLSRPSSSSSSSDGRVHRHVGWDELAPAGRRQAHATRPAPAPAQTGPVGDVTRPSDG